MLHSIKQFLQLPQTPLSLFEKAWLFAPIAIWFSYHPLIRFGRNASMHFELSVTLVYVSLLALCGLPSIWRHRAQLRHNRSLIPVSIFVFIAGCSLLWTVDSTRGFFTFALIGVLYAVYVATVSESSRLGKLLLPLSRILILSAVVMGFLALFQMIAGIWLDRETVLLCRGCTPEQFGFARPNVFAIEPQFFGNLLLAPALMLLHAFLSPKNRLAYNGWLLFFVTTSLLLTLSRGAIFAFAIGVACILIIKTADGLARFRQAVVVMAASFAACLFIQASLAALNPKLDTSFMRAIRVSINQLSLGVIELPIEEDHRRVQSSTPVTDTAQMQTRKALPEQTEKTPVFDGYVEESTNVRLKLSSLGLQAWQQSTPRMVFGVGLGGSGYFLNQTFPAQVGQREIIQNEYVEILLENGLLGLLSFAGIIGALVFKLRRTKWLWAIIGAFLVQWNFFSGYPNALHIYLIFMLMSILSTGIMQPKRQKPSTRKA